MTFLYLLPVILCALVLGAHFFRAGQILPMIASLLLPFLLLVRRGWTARLVQVALLAGAVEWIRTLARLTALRRSSGEPWIRLTIILGGMALLTAASALVFETARLKRRRAGWGTMDSESSKGV